MRTAKLTSKGLLAVNVPCQANFNTNHLITFTIDLRKVARTHSIASVEFAIESAYDRGDHLSSREKSSIIFG